MSIRMCPPVVVDRLHVNTDSQHAADLSPVCDLKINIRSDMLDHCFIHQLLLCVLVTEQVCVIKHCLK